MSLDEAMREDWKELSKSSRFQCPITGSSLDQWSRPKHFRPLDYPIYYRSADNPDLIWMRNPRNLDFLTLVESVGAFTGIRFFRWVDNQWKEIFEVKGYGIFFTGDTPSEEIQKEKDRIDEERRINAEAISLLPKAIKVKAMIVSSGEVKPMEASTGILMWHDFRYSDELTEPKWLTPSDVKSLPTIPVKQPRPNHY
jgi:hypothetical protein